jgi:hypothetical protein
LVRLTLVERGDRTWALTLILSLRERSEIMPSGYDRAQAFQQPSLSLSKRSEIMS